jgi:hypothetical protein
MKKKKKKKKKKISEFLFEGDHPQHNYQNVCSEFPSFLKILSFCFS